MNESKILSVLASGVLLLAGCASRYDPPKTTPSALVVSVSGSRDVVYQKAVAALAAEGYAVAAFDPALAVISTQRRPMPLTESDVDVGSTRGISYVKDERTTVYVTMLIQVNHNRAVIRSNIEAEYRLDDPTKGQLLKGVSKGTVEQRIAVRMRD